MKCRHIKLIMELIFIFILPFIFICFTSELKEEKTFEYDNNGNYEEATEDKYLTFDNSIIKYTKQDTDNIYNVRIYATEVVDLGNYYYYTDYLNTENILSSTIYLENYGIGGYSCYVLAYNDNQAITNVYLLSANSFLIISSNDKYIRLARLKTSTYITMEEFNQYLNVYYKSNNIIVNTIWGTIKQLLIKSLDLNDNILVDLIICYTILWFVMFVIWHILYFGFDSLFHLLDRKRE